MGCYVMVGLASRRILLHPSTDHMVAQVFRLQQPHGGETSIRVRQTERHPAQCRGKKQLAGYMLMYVREGQQ